MSTGLSFSTSVISISGGDLQVNVVYSCDGGGSGSLTVAALESTVLGTATVPVIADGVPRGITVPVPPTLGSWASPGSAVVAAVLLNAVSASVADLPPTVLTVS